MAAFAASRLWLVVAGAFAMMAMACSVDAIAPPADFNTVWTTTTGFGTNNKGQQTYADGMPLGNGDTAVLAWGNSTSGGVSMYVSKADAMSSATELLKVALVHVSLAAPPAGQPQVEQRLDLSTATMTFSQASGSTNVTYTVYVDANSNTVVISATSTTPVSLVVDVVPLRPVNITSTPPFYCEHTTWAADVVAAPTAAFKDQNTLILYHRNHPEDGNVVNQTLTQQGLASLIAITPDHWAQRQFGMAVASAGSSGDFVRASGTQLKSKQPTQSAAVRISLLSNQPNTPDEWLSGLADKANQPLGPRASHVAWWSQFWNRSHVLVNASTYATPSNALTLSRKYAETRYVQAIQSRGTIFPIKFNGQLFGANVYPNQDYRDWGPSSWWQNTRLPYGPMLAMGDFDTFETILNFFDNMMAFAKARTQTYFNHSGIYFTETKAIFGAYAPVDYGCKRDPKYPVFLETNSYIHLDYGGDGGTTEIALAVLDYFLYTNDQAKLKQYLPIATEAADFFMQHYNNRTTDGKYVFWPTQALETFWCEGWDTVNNRPPSNCCVDDLPTIAGVVSVLEKLLALPAGLLTPAQHDAYAKFAASMPDIPRDASKRQLLPARVLSTGKHNSEAPEMYSVHPFRLYTAARNVTAQGVDLTDAINSYHANPLSYGSNSGWNQGIMDAALLGLTDEAVGKVLQRVGTSPARGYRWEAFAPHEQDYEPSADHYANMVAAVNWMLMAPADDGFEDPAIVLFPAWPCDWDVSFKLAAPLSTVVSVEYAGGKVVSLDVQPPSRASAIKWANCGP